MEFHISGRARRRYRFDDSLFAYRNNVIFANFHAARLFAQRMNEKRGSAAPARQAVRSGQINAMGLIDEILHHVISVYRSREVPALYPQAMTWLEDQVGERKLNAALRAFLKEFPPSPVYQGKLTVTQYMAGESDGIPNRAAAAEELLFLWLTNQNPAFSPYLELFDDSRLAQSTAYKRVSAGLHDFFETQPRFGPDSQNLVDMLRSPAIAVPNSLNGQLEYMRSRWGDLLGHYLLKLLGSLNLLSEEERLRGLGPGPIPIPVYGAGMDLESERFSLDADWMPRLVLIAKNTYVWLDQLSRKYQRPITRLDQIPDEELDTLASWGITGLWLIGLWERSRASARIKQLCGNPEAIASAYSLREYSIADDLGGEDAYRSLRERAWQRGVRLASDMVPNHMGIDSAWVYQHPDWFISMPYSPFPSYSFNGEDLSDNPQVEIRIEDHYYSRTDAAVVFRHHDHAQNKTRYIYHGNDGTSMPWNDTAQLNYLDPEVREAVIQAILSVAKRFPIIRFDAAMTLALRHFQRLWFPQPGGGCDIPSRSEFSLTAEQFYQYMPQEFWREVVDRVAAEAPDTLLLAEAFWLMEGYFVRTLGMHRVYNSAFMNLLRDEENAKYRQVMRNTLEFDPQILKRFVNFMNNPDEHTAASQFGKGDKYFGICTLLATMPGLPMFGHGQMEGFTEKYGMEYKRAYLDEQTDRQLMDRHAWQIFPLLKKRYLFSDVENFYLYDFYTPDGQVDENVFAYSNRQAEERSLVVYHNKFGDTRGWVRNSAAFMNKAAGALQQVDLRTGLDLPAGRNKFVIFKDRFSGLEYIRSCAEIAQKGLFIQLDAYRAHVFLDFRVVQDDDRHAWQHVHDQLNGRGIADIERYRWELPLQTLLHPLREIINPAYLGFMLQQQIQAVGGELPEYLINEAEHKLIGLSAGVAALLGEERVPEPGGVNFRDRFARIFQAAWVDQELADVDPEGVGMLMTLMREELHEEKWLAVFIWSYLGGLRGSLGLGINRFLELVQEWRIPQVVEEAIRGMGMPSLSPVTINQSVDLLLRTEGWLKRFGRRSTGKIARALLEDYAIRQYLLVNEYDGKRWFNQQAFGSWWTFLTFEGVWEILVSASENLKQTNVRMKKLAELLLRMRASAPDAGYELDKWLEILDRPAVQE